MHPKNYGSGQSLKPTPDTVEPCDHDPGDSFDVFCPTCEEETRGTIEGGYEGCCWRCTTCGDALDLTA